MKNLLYSSMIVCLAIAGFTSCDPQESDSYDLGSKNILSQDQLSWNVTSDESEKGGTYTFTNTSQNIEGATYTITTNGSNLTSFPIGATVELVAKKNATYTVTMYSSARGELQELTWTKVVDWIPVPDPTTSSDPQWLGYTEGTDLLATWYPDNNYWFSPSDWSGGINPEIDGDIHSGLSFSIPEGTGDSQWQAQIHLENGGPTLSAGKTYDFSIAIEASEDMSGDGVTVKPQKSGDDNTFFSDARHKIKKGLNVISLAGCDGFDGEFKLALDFAGAPIGSTITIKRVFLTEHNSANSTADTWAFDYMSDNNVLKNQAFGADFRFWFADGGWVQISDPEYEGETSAEFSLTIPDGMGVDQWQGQVHIPFDDVNLSASKNYDVSLVVIADGDVPGLTVKAQNDADDNSFLTADRHSIPANIPTAVTLTDLPGFDGKFRMCLDFGGTAAGTHVKILGMYVGEHK